jgi:hypothetical protein
MSWAFTALGVHHDADERTVKRAYAQRLRSVRPDTDPEGFQALHEAYQAALDAIRWRGRDADAAPRMRSWRAPSADTNDTDEGDGARDLGVRFTLSGGTVSDGISSERIGSESTGSDSTGSDSIAFDTIVSDRLDLRLNDDASSREPSRDSDAANDARDNDRAWDADANRWAADAPVDPSSRRQMPPPLPPADDEDDWDDSSIGQMTGDTVALADACIAQASLHNGNELSAWLHAKPEFWSLQMKTRTGHVVFLTLEAQTPAPTIASQNLEILLNFFGLDEIGGEIDGYRLERMRRRIRQAWLLRAPMQDGPRYGRRMVYELQRPYRPFDSILRGMIPGRPAAVGRLLAALDVDGFGGMPPECDPRQTTFWQAASNPARFGRWRLAIDFGRALVANLLLALLGAVALIGISQANGGELTWPVGVQLLWGAPMLMALIYTLSRTYVAWMPSSGWRHGWVFAAWIPLLAGTTYWLDNGLALTAPAIGLNLLALMLTTMRWATHYLGDFRYQFAWWHIFVAIPLLKVLGLGAVFAIGIVEVGAAAVSLVWAFEATIFAIAFLRSRR